MRRSAVSGWVIALICLPVCARAAQKMAAVPAATTSTAQAPSTPAPIEEAPVTLAPSEATTAPPVQSGADAGQAPDAATKKISELVHAGKYADAQQLTSGLLLAYPNDQRLIKAQALIAKLMAGGSASASGGQAAPRAADASSGLTGMDKVDYNALIELARQAQESTDLDEQTKLLQQFMEQSVPFLQKHPEQMLLWQLRAAAAISRNQPMEGYQAGTKLIELGAADSNDPSLQQLLAKLQLLGWLDKQKVQELQAAADEERRAAREFAENAKDTFPVVHLDGLHYEYGHLTIKPDEAVYTGTDETAHIARSNVRDVSVACNVDGCGMYFTQIKGRRFYFLPVIESDVTNKTAPKGSFLAPSVIGNAVVARWKFVASGKNNKTLSPAPEGAASGKDTAAPAKSGSMMKAMAPAVGPGLVAPASAPAAAGAAVAEVSANPMAVLHVYRPHHMTGATEKFDVSVDGKKLAKLANSQMVRLEVAPGKHNVSVEGRHMDDKIPLEDFAMTAGEEYWIKVDVDAGAFSAHTELQVVPVEQAENEVKGFKDVSDDEGKK